MNRIELGAYAALAVMPLVFALAIVQAEGCAASSPAPAVVPSSVSIAHVGDATVICTTLGAEALRDAGELQ